MHLRLQLCIALSALGTIACSNGGFVGLQGRAQPVRTLELYSTAESSATAGSGNIYLGQSHHPFKGVGWHINARLPLTPQIYKLLDETSLQFVRVGITPDIIQPRSDLQTYEGDEIKNVYQFLNYTKQKNISVMVTNWDSGGGPWAAQTQNLWPNNPFWLSAISNLDPTNSLNRFCHKKYSGDPGQCSETDKAQRVDITGVESDHPVSDFAFASVLANHLSYMIKNKGLSIDFYTLWNEPNGDWAYHPRDASKKYPASFTGLYQSFHNALSAQGLAGQVKVTAMDESFHHNTTAATKANVDFALSQWDGFTQAYGLHNYDAETGSNGVIKYLFDRAHGEPIVLGELGHGGPNGCGEGFDRWGNSIESTRLMISDVRHGVYAAARWWFYGGDPSTDCWVAVGSTPIPENYNSVKILANTLPQIRQDFSVLNTDFDFSATAGNVDGVAINGAPPGARPRLVLWFVNKGSVAYSFQARLQGFQENGVAFHTKQLSGLPPYAITSGPKAYASASSPVLNLTLPPNSIVVVEQGSENSQPSAPAIISPATNSVLDGRQALVKWTAVDGVVHYRVRMVDSVSGAVIIDSLDVGATEVSLPVTTGRSYEVLVQALNPTDWAYKSEVASVRFSVGTLTEAASVVYIPTNAYSNDTLTGWPTESVYDSNPNTVFSTNGFVSPTNTRGAFLAAWIAPRDGGSPVNTVYLQARSHDGAPMTFPVAYDLYITNSTNTNWDFVGHFTTQPVDSGPAGWIATIALDQIHYTHGMVIIPTVLGADSFGGHYLQLADVALGLR